MKITETVWGEAQGKKILKYRLENKSGAYVELSSVGAGIVGIGVPDAKGEIADVVLGYPKPESYFGDGPCAGKIPGRFANRIAKGHLEVDGKVYSLPILNSAKDVIKNKMSANIISCGVVNELTHVATQEAMERAVLNHVPKGTGDTNLAALRLGGQMIREYSEK